jgi:ABC-type sugar transport system ATPase subunit
MVHQELLFCENLTVAENLCLGDLPSRGPFVSRGRMVARARQHLAEINADIDPTTTLGALPISRQQLVQIAAAVARGARILVFDEPTSSLSQRETEHLFELITRLRQRGVTMIYISHRLHEIFRIADAVTVLRDGEVVATRPVSEYNEDRLVRQMIGRPLEQYFPVHLAARPGEELLRVEGLSSPGRFQDVSFCLRSGEILGLAGLVGAGRTEIAEAIFGLDPHATGRVLIRAAPIRVTHPARAMGGGVGLIPEDRKRYGLVLSMNARENISLPSLRRLSRFGWIRLEAEKQLARRYFERLDVRAPRIDADTGGLSGGNQQKLVIARWMAAECSILLVDEPTRGVDVRAKAEIHGLIDSLAHSGAGVLLISSELPEIINLSTRILVIRNGRISGEVARSEADQDRLLRLMAGVAGRS